MAFVPETTPEQDPTKKSQQQPVLPRPGQPNVYTAGASGSQPAVPRPGEGTIYSATGSGQQNAPTAPGQNPYGESTGVNQGRAAGSGVYGDPPAQGGGGGNIPAGWTDAGNGMYRNAATGQMLPANHPDFIALQGGGGSGGNGQPGGGTQNTTPQSDEEIQRQALLQQMQANSQPVTVDDATIQAQLQPFAAAQERERRTAENEAAERASTMGMGSSGALDNQRRSLQERAGQATGLRASDLVGREVASRREDLARYLQMNQGRLDANAERQLRERLANMDAQLRREGYSLQGQLGNRELDIRDRLGTGGLSNDLLRILSQRQQFGQDLDFRSAMGEANINNDIMRILMGG